MDRDFILHTKWIDTKDKRLEGDSPPGAGPGAGDNYTGEKNEG